MKKLLILAGLCVVAYVAKTKGAIGYVNATTKVTGVKVLKVD